METIDDLKGRFDKLKIYITEDWAEVEGKLPPTDIEVWQLLRVYAVKNMDYAMADDMEYYVQLNQNRIQIIDEKLKSLTRKM